MRQRIGAEPDTANIIVGNVKDNKNKKQNRGAAPIPLHVLVRCVTCEKLELLNTKTFNVLKCDIGVGGCSGQKAIVKTASNYQTVDFLSSREISGHPTHVSGNLAKSILSSTNVF